MSRGIPNTYGVPNAPSLHMASSRLLQTSSIPAVHLSFGRRKAAFCEYFLVAIIQTRFMLAII